ncbi:hypothetical protein IPM19_01675 [bacterium]|nr:MAG: hypothetical protein IPM19_01675 [bacterium]
MVTLLVIFAAFTLLGSRHNHIKGWAKKLNCHPDNATSLFYALFGALLGIAIVGLVYLPNKELGLAVKIMAIPTAFASYYLISSVVNMPITRDEGTSD